MTNKKQLTIFTYGILRKRSLLKRYLKDYNLDKIRIEPDKIEGYVAYHSGSINMVFPVRQKQKDKYPDAPFIVKGSTVTFYGLKENINRLEKDIDAMESAYRKDVIETEVKDEAIIYVMEQGYKQLYNLYGIGLIIYPDSIMNSLTLYADGYTFEEDAEQGLKQLFEECC